MEHDGWTYIFLTGQRKAFHHDVPGDWDDVAYERFDYVECGVWRKRTADLTAKDRDDWVQYHGEPDQNFISPGDWHWPSAPSAAPALITIDELQAIFGTEIPMAAFAILATPGTLTVDMVRAKLREYASDNTPRMKAQRALTGKIRSWVEEYDLRHSVAVEIAEEVLAAFKDPASLS